MRKEQKNKFLAMEKGRYYGEDLDVKITFKNPKLSDDNEPERIKKITRDLQLILSNESTFKKKKSIKEEIDFDDFER